MWTLTGKKPKTDFHLRLFAVAFALGLFLQMGCTTVPEGSAKPGDAAQATTAKEFSSRIEDSLRKKIALLDAPEIETYLDKVAGRIFSPGRDPIRVELVNAAAANYGASLWAIPNGKVFIDIRLLRSLKFENEIAAAVAFAWDRSESSEFRDRLIQEAGKADPNPELIWKFSEAEDHRAIEASIDRLYKAGYDPRGLVNYFDRLPKKAKSKNTDPAIESNKDKARRTISYYAPLLNPIVRTEDFYRMRKKLEHL